MLARIIWIAWWSEFKQAFVIQRQISRDRLSTVEENGFGSLAIANLCHEIPRSHNRAWLWQSIYQAGKISAGRRNPHEMKQFVCEYVGDIFCATAQTLGNSAIILGFDFCNI